MTRDPGGISDSPTKELCQLVDVAIHRVPGPCSSTRQRRTMGGRCFRFAPLVVGILSACSSSQEAGDGGVPTKEALHRFEAEFDPTQYNPDIEAIVKNESPDQINPVGLPVEIANPPQPELVQGFRVQIHSSTSIDQTSHQREVAEELFPAEWFYMVYDPPTYKLRAGNFLNRFEADRFLKELKATGFRDSWIVPDRVVQNPGPRPLAPSKEPQE